MSIIKKYNAKYIPEKKIKYSISGITFPDDVVDAKEDLIVQQNQLEIHLEELEKTKGEILDNARQEANGIINKASKDAKKIKEDAYATGHDDGYMRGYEEGFEKGYNEKHLELEKNIQDVKDTKAKYEKIYQDYLYHAEEDVLEIVTSLTESIIGKELSQDKSLIKILVIEAIEKCAKKDKIVARVSESNYPIVEENKDMIIQNISGLDSLKVVSDDTLSNDEVLIETPYGDISSSLESKLDNVKSSLFDMLKEYRKNS